MKRLVIIIVATVLAVCSLGALVSDPDLAKVFGLPADPFAASIGLVSCSASASTAAGVSLTKHQVTHAATIFEVATKVGVGEAGAVVGIATAMQESTLHNYGHLGDRNDHDSLGLFQQRPSQGWGSPEQVTDPRHASQTFFQRLKGIDGWRSMSVTRAAQAVQRSAFPDAYAKWEKMAVDLVDHFASTCTTDWKLPVDAGIVSGYRTATRPDHDGIDLGAERGTRVNAAAAGTVTTATCNAMLSNGRSYSCDRDGSESILGCGWYVEIRHRDDSLTRYCHLGRQPEVNKGQKVSVGDRLGVVGSSGNSSGPHLHFETHSGCEKGTDEGVSGCVPTDPVSFLHSRGIDVPA